jgi:murein DD-endopeptidase MepM/ murein hydrolase activator NlpD
VSPLAYLGIGAGVLFIWSGFANPSGGFFGELTRILKNQPLAGSIKGTGSSVGDLTGLSGTVAGSLSGGAATGVAGAVSASGVAWPVPGHTGISQKYGENGHPGVDIPAPVGTQIVAVMAGRVTFAGLTDPGGFGALIKIAHDAGGGTWYGHVQSWSVTAGQHVQAGQPIGTVGARGNSTGPHLHLEWHTGSVDGPRTDPLAVLGATGG